MVCGQESRLGKFRRFGPGTSFLGQINLVLQGPQVAEVSNEGDEYRLAARFLLDRHEHLPDRYHCSVGSDDAGFARP